MLPDAPLFQLLSVQHNPLVTEMSDSQLLALVQKLRALASSPPTLSAKINEDGTTTKPKRATRAKVLTPEQQRRQALLDDL